MMRRICLSAAFVMFAAPAFAAADDACTNPTAPTMPNGKTAAREEIIAAANNVKAYVADSDKYQACLKGVLEGMDQEYTKADAQAKADKKPLATKVKVDYTKTRAELVKKGEANQTTKEKLGASYAATAAAYRSAHPTPAAAR
jgi:hypothetical protein